MPVPRRSIRCRCCKHKVNKRKVDHLGGQIDKFKVRKHVVDQIADNEISKFKVDKNMLDQPTHVQISELKPDGASSRLHNYKFGSGMIEINPEVITVQAGQGYFEMLSLCGSYKPSEADGMSIRTGGLSVSLVSLNGRVFGGRVSGPLIAASPVQVVIGRFPVGEKNKLKWAATGGIPGSSSSTPEGALNGSSRKPRSPPNQSASSSFNTGGRPVLSNIP